MPDEDATVETPEVVGNTTIEERPIAVTLEDGTEAVMQGTITTIDYGEVDEDGYPKISVNVGVSPLPTEPTQEG